MIILFVLGLLLGIFGVLFALQNVTIVTISFFSWELAGPLSIILLITIAFGMLVALLLVLPESVVGHFRHKNLQKENKKLSEDLEKQKELTIFAKHTSPTEAEISKIEQGEIAHPTA